jgi:hypothetical protein
MTDFENGTSFVYSAFYRDEDDEENNVGSPLIFIINKDLSPTVRFEDLKRTPNAIQYFFSTDHAHNTDDDDGTLPVVKASWLNAPNADPKERACVL